MSSESSPKPLVPDHEVLRKIGEGSYGQVWLAQNHTGSYRAVKIVSWGAEDNGRAFDREFQGIKHYEPISRLHPSLMEILQVGRKEGFFYYVMELADDALVPRSTSTTMPRTDVGPAGPLVTGHEKYAPDTLKLRIQRDGRLSVDQCLEIGLALTDALAQLHERGLVHRDIKPSNIIFVRGKPKLTDIGLVTAINARSVVGTPGYIPLEGAGSAQADLYSLGRVLYEASTGKPPDAFPEPATVLDADEVDAWAELNEVMLRACQPLPEQRYGTAKAMHSELERLRAGASIRRLRRAEGRLKLLRKVGAAGAVLGVLIAAGFFLQAKEALRFRKLAQESSLRLRQLHVANGLRAIEDGDLLSSLVWLTEAMKVRADARDAGQGRQVTKKASIDTTAVTDESLERGRWETIWRQCPRIVRLGAHDGPIASAVFSPDARTVLTASLDHSACLWDISDGHLIWRLLHDQILNYACFSRDGRRVVTCCDDGCARVWDVATGQPSYSPLRHDAKVLHAAFSPDGTRLVTCSADATARLWDARSGNLVRVLFKTAGEVNYTEFSPDGSWFVTASDDTVARVWDALSGEPVGPPLTHPDHVRQARFSPDGRLIVTACRDGGARIFDTQTGALKSGPFRHTAPLLYAFFNHDRTRIVSGGGASATDADVRAWNAITGEPISRLSGLHTRSRTSTLSPDGRYVATTSEDKTLLIWDIETGRLVAPPLHHNHSVWDAQWSPDGCQILSTSRDGTWRLWELATGSALDPVLHRSVPIGGARFARDGRRVYVRGILGERFEGLDLSLWDPTSGTFQPVQAAGWDALLESAIRWRRLDPAVHHTYEDITYEDMRVPKVIYNCTNVSGLLCFSPGGDRLLVACQDQVARFWDMSTGEPVGPGLRHDDFIHAGTFSPDGQLVITGSGPFLQTPGEGKVWTWSAKTGQLVRPPLRVAGVPVLAVSPNGRRLLVGTSDSSANPHFAQLYDLQSGKPFGPPFWHGDGISCVGFTPDGSKVVTAAEDGSCRLWDLATGAPTTPLLLHKRGITMVSFAPDGRRMVTASGDGTARIWDSLTGEALSPPLQHRDRVASAYFSEKGDVLVTAGWDRTCRIWRLPITERPINDLLLMAQLQSGVRIDATASPSPIASAELCSLWKGLFARYPGDFSPTEADKTSWHRLQEADCESVQNWSAARFHLERLLNYKPADEELRNKLHALETHLATQPAAARDAQAQPGKR